jgi:hypothetical protein
VEENRQVGLKQPEITIRGKYGDLVPRRNGADEKVGIRSLDSITATQVEEFSRGLVIAGCHFKIGKCSQVIAQFPELSFVPDSREEFLSNWSDDSDPYFLDQLD